MGLEAWESLRNPKEIPKGSLRNPEGIPKGSLGNAIQNGSDFLRDSLKIGQTSLLKSHFQRKLNRKTDYFEGEEGVPFLERSYYGHVHVNPFLLAIPGDPMGSLGHLIIPFFLKP